MTGCSDITLHPPLCSIVFNYVWCGTKVPHLPLQARHTARAAAIHVPAMNSRHMTARPRRHDLAIERSPGGGLVPRSHQSGATWPGRPGARGRAWAPAWLIAGPVLCPGPCAARASAGLASARPGHCRAWLLPASPAGCTMQPAGLVIASTTSAAQGSTGPVYLALPSLFHTGPGNLALNFLCHTGPGNLALHFLIKVHNQHPPSLL